MNQPELEIMLAEAEQIVSELDRHCAVLLACMSFKQKQAPHTQFNELYTYLQNLKKQGIISLGFSRKTLSEHLKHLLEKNLISVNEDTNSKLKIKPRKYALSPKWLKIVSETLEMNEYSVMDLLKEFGNVSAEQLTMSLIDYLVGECVKIMHRSLNYPENLAEYYRETIFEFVNKLARAYRERVLSRQEKAQAETALREFAEKYARFMEELCNAR